MEQRSFFGVFAAVVVVFVLVAFGARMLFAEEGEQKMNSAKKPAQEELKQKLTPLQYDVTQHDATERPFQNEYWDNKKPGIYVDVVSGEPLFSSLDKYDSGTGWPSFSKPLEAESMTYKTDTKILYPRTEVRSKSADSHLGHLFDDGPSPTGKRFCMNSAALRFIPAEKLAEEGLGHYTSLFAASSAALTSPTPAAVSSAASAEQKQLSPKKEDSVVLAGGCFWGMEEILRKIPGVLRTRVGYAGGGVENPVYKQVTTGTTGHAESVEVVFDPSKLSFEQLLGFFFRMHDPSTLNRQGNDRGTQYRSAIFYTSDEQRTIAEKVKDEVERSGKWKNPIVTQIVPATPFYEAEDYHQDYLEKNPSGYTCHFLRD